MGHYLWNSTLKSHYYMMAQLSLAFSAIAFVFFQALVLILTAGLLWSFTVTFLSVSFLGETPVNR